MLIAPYHMLNDWRLNTVVHYTLAVGDILIGINLFGKMGEIRLERATGGRD